MKSIWRALAENVIIETRRLLLRPKTLEDAEDIFEFESNPNVARFVFQVEEDIENTKEYIAKSMREPLGKFAIVWKENEKVIGVMDFIHLELHSRVAEVGYSLNETYWKRGIATEALTALLKMAFEEMELLEVKGEHDIENVASGKVMAKSGMNRGNTYKKQDKITKTIRKYTKYSLTKQGYLDVKKEREEKEINLF